uniref:U-stichotoxin-Hau1a n=2 Tax=Stichodactylidae TaxID=42825 RepID=TX1A_HETAU|nr:peptide toxin [Heteractis aurora]
MKPAIFLMLFVAMFLISEGEGFKPKDAPQERSVFSPVVQSCPRCHRRDHFGKCRKLDPCPDK